MNYLQLCQDYVAELGIAGSTQPLDVTGQTGELNNVTRWIRDASVWIDNLWLDWKYLWNLYNQTFSTVDGVTLALPAPGGGVSVRLWDINKVRWRQTGTTNPWQPLQYVTRQQMFSSYDVDNALPGAPDAFTIQPDNTLTLNAPIDVPYDFRGEFWRRPLVLTAKTDVPLIPVEMHRIIICRAAVMYGNREDAPEIISGLTAEYMDMLDKLQSDQLEGWALRRSSTDRERREPLGDITQWLR